MWLDEITQQINEAQLAAFQFLNLTGKHHSFVFIGGPLHGQCQESPLVGGPYEKYRREYFGLDGETIKLYIHESLTVRQAIEIVIKDFLRANREQ